ncbi:ATP-binding cassette domain-containing protein [Streptomyces sp. NPDC014748]|uniref:ATP-binding cassette domain-containing protein n=1 Tax=Streptomyces sp. NPDC014748 TaxID=3364905 RepID=UPI0036FF9E0B
MDQSPRETALGAPRGLAVTARGFGLRGPRGWAFRDVDVNAAPGSLIAVEGPSGSGRTCLLLALTGRMKPTEGVAEVGGLKPPRRMSALRRVSALANVAGVTDLEPALTVGEHLRERALLQRRFGAAPRALLRSRVRRRAEAREAAEAALTAAGLDVAALPKGARTAVRDLERLEELRLSIALALMSGPRLLAVDDADHKLSGAERAEVWELLGSLAASGTTVLAVCSEAPEDAVVVSTAGPAKPGTADGDGTAAGGTGDTAETGGPAADDSAAGDGTPADAAPEDGERAEHGGAAAHGGTAEPRTPADGRTTTRDGVPAAEDEEGAADALAETGRS